MAGELLIATNPKRRKRKMSAKQRAAAIRNLKKARAKRRRNPVVTLANPRRRKKRRASASPHRMVRRRRNPLPKLGLGGLQKKLMPALIGGAGAVGNDVLYNFAVNALPASTPMLDSFKAGPLRHVGKAASAMLLGWAASMVVGRRRADELVTGALIVIGYNVVREGVEKVAPGKFNLGMYLEPGSGMRGLGYPGAGWNPTYGADWRARSGLAAYIPPGPVTTPGAVRVPSQFNERSPFGMRSAPMYADELESGT